MSARSIATGTISFGLVAIPVKMYSTTESSKSISFSWLHDKCQGRVKQQYYCPKDDEPVDRKHLIKGYQFAKEQYVVFSQEELKAFDAKATHSIDIVEFVPDEQVDPLFFEKAYYLGPNVGGDRPYKLLTAAMRDTGRVAIARYAARGKMYIVLLRPYQDGVIMQQLRYADEVKSFSEVPIGDIEVDEKELALARMLVEQIASDKFDPAAYEDETRKAIWQMIEQKIEGKEFTAVSEEAPQGQIIDLMEALKASLAPSDGGNSAERKPPKRARSSKKAESKESSPATKTRGRKRAAAGSDDG
jgi:DNA end-binding protein Ku